MAKDELIVGRENFPQFAGSISVELLDMRLDKNMLSFLNLSTIKFRIKKFFAEKIFVSRFLIAKVSTGINSK